MSTPYLELTVLGEYTEMVTPPRCRNPRSVQRDTATIIELPDLIADEAPVAFSLATTELDELTEIRTWQGRLFEPMRTNHAGQPRHPIRFGSPEFPTKVAYNSRVHDDYDTHLEYVHYRYGNLVVIDGYVWQPTGEPRYVVQTFGLGGNHGGTDLYVTNYDNPNIAADAYFRADQHEQAQTHAIEVAQRRGDTDSVGRIAQQTPRIHVHVPEAVTLQVPPPEPRRVAELRSELRAAVRGYGKLLDGEQGDLDPAEVFGRITGLRAEIGDLTPDIEGLERHRRPTEQR